MDQLDRTICHQRRAAVCRAEVNDQNRLQPGPPLAPSTATPLCLYLYAQPLTATILNGTAFSFQSRPGPCGIKRLMAAGASTPGGMRMAVRAPPLTSAKLGCVRP